MSLSGSYEVIISALGISIQGTSGTLEASQGIDPVDTTVTAAKAVTDWVRTSPVMANCVLPDGHGFTDGRFDVFWDGGKRYWVVGTIVDNTLSFDCGEGDLLPDSGNTTVVVCPQKALDLTFDGDNLVLIGAISSRPGLLIFRDSGNILIGSPVELLANVPWGWATGRGTNPLAGNAVASGSISNSSTAGTASFKLTGLQYAV